jgi:glycosyltransferase involved in cell wall biosynthesis
MIPRQPLISIIIPAYRRLEYLERLLNSIINQHFRDFEVIITDDSPDDSVLALVNRYIDKLPIFYFHNSPSLGTPANWNMGISKATGEWIKLMHDDDWFAGPNSLQKFADATASGKNFIFSAYANHFEEINKPDEKKFLPPSWGLKIQREPMTLLAYNVIGPPSVVMVHRSFQEKYDERLKWRVDMEYYVRILNKNNSFHYINHVLINVGVSESQVTQSCIYNPKVELPEGRVLLLKHGVYRLRNIWVYDAWWRLLRNMHIISAEQLQQYAPGEWPTVIQHMIRDIAALPKNLRKVGGISKSFMFVSYIKNKSLIISQPR